MFKLQLLHNIGYIPRVIQYIFELMLLPTFYTFLSLFLILLFPMVTSSFFLCEYAFWFYSLGYFLDSTIKGYHIVFVSL